MLAADHGSVGAVEALVAAGADLELRDVEGQTALACAVCEGHVGVVDALIAAGADTSAAFDLCSS